VGKKIPAKLLTVDNEGRSHYAEILIDEDTGEEVQPEEKPSASDKKDRR
jgi:hypothetical protein